MARVGNTREKGLAGRRRVAAAALAALLCLQALPAAALAGAQEPGQPEAADVAAEGEGAGNGGYDPDGVNGNGPGEGAGTEEGAQDGTGADGEDAAGNGAGAGGEDEPAAGSGGSDGAQDGTDPEGDDPEGDENGSEDADGAEAPAPARTAAPGDGDDPAAQADEVAPDHMLTATNWGQLQSAFSKINAGTDDEAWVITVPGGTLDLANPSTTSWNLNLNRGNVTITSDGDALTIDNSGANTAVLQVGRNASAVNPVLNIGRPDRSETVRITEAAGARGYAYTGGRCLVEHAAGEVNLNGSIEFLGDNQASFWLRGSNQGGAFRITGPSVSFPGGTRSCVLVFGDALTTSGSYSIEITDTVFENFDQAQDANFIRCALGPLLIDNCEFRNITRNAVGGADRNPSAFISFNFYRASPDCRAIISDTTFDNVSTNGDRPIVYTWLSTLRMSNVAFSNCPVGKGGLVRMAEMAVDGKAPDGLPAALLSRCTFTGNFVADEDRDDSEKVAMVLIDPADSTAGHTNFSYAIEDCAFRDNSASGIAGALYVRNNGAVSVARTVFENNRSKAGGAVEVSRARAEFVDCAFTGNAATGTDPLVSGGGALYVHDGAEVSVEGGRISGNSAEFHGGGVWLSDESTLTMEGVKVSGNTTAAHGGGVSIPYKRTEAEADSVLTMTSCTVEGNAAAEFGGGVQAMSGKVALTNCTITGNVAGSEDPDAPGADLAEGSHGGGIWAESGLGHLPGGAAADYAESPAAITVTGGEVSGNRAGDHAGGAGASQGAMLEMTGVEVTGNWAGDHGGGALSEGGSSDGTPSEVVLTGCEVTGNEALAHGGGVGAAPEGGAVTSRDGSAAPAGRLTVSGGEVAGNSAGGHGGGACAEEGAFMDLSTARVYGNSAGDWADDVNVNDGAEVLLGVAFAAPLPGGGRPSDGWYLDAEGARWAALIALRPSEALPLAAGPGIEPAGAGWRLTSAVALKDARGTDAQFYEPTPGRVETVVGGSPGAAEGVANAGSLPEGTRFEWAVPPDTSAPGTVGAVVRVVYPDGTSEEVEVEVVVSALPEEPPAADGPEAPSGGDGAPSGPAALLPRAGDSLAALGGALASCAALAAVAAALARRRLGAR